VFIRLARGPVLRPENLRPNDYAPSSIHELAALPNVLLADPEAFDSLERPEYFGDGLHLNKAGIAIFSPLLARTVAQMLGPAN
jgi:lysophospholipase L1-like esterase